MTIRGRRFIAALLSCAFLALPACAPEGADLAEAIWVLDLPEKWSDPPSTLMPTEVTLQFLPREGAVQGTFGLQKYAGGYAVEGDAISFSTLCFTTLACMAAGGTLNREQEYLFALEDAQSYRVDGDTLTIDCGDQVLTF
ncbi:MAG: META domain-containing protein, partial [Dehalococcoidia bacterium]|nr:META domain-containing protein [Dehalococcoidia bacterium]